MTNTLATSRVESRGVSLGAAAWQVFRLPGLISATIGTALLLVIAGVSLRAARRRVHYETWHNVHLLVYLAVALAFLHQLGGPDLAGQRLMQMAWALLFTQTITLVIRHRVLTPVRNATRHQLRVHEVREERPGVVSIVIKGRYLDELDAQAGHFFRWRFLTPDHWHAAHPFSLSAPPVGDWLRLTVKALGDGSRALQGLERGTWVIAEDPYVAVTAHRRIKPKVVLIAGGVGITPMRALFETLPVATGQEVLLLYRGKSKEELLFTNELEAIAERRPGVRLQYLLGDMARNLNPSLLRAVVPDIVQRDVFICGSPRMMSEVRASLRSLGLPKGQLHEERFDF